MTFEATTLRTWRPPVVNANGSMSSTTLARAGCHRPAKRGSRPWRTSAGSCTRSCATPPSTCARVSITACPGNSAIIATVTTLRATGAHAGAKKRSSLLRMPIASAEKEMAGRNGNTTLTRWVVSCTSTLPASEISNLASRGAARYASSIKTPLTTASRPSRAPDRRLRSSVPKEL